MDKELDDVFGKLNHFVSSVGGPKEQWSFLIHKDAVVINRSHGIGLLLAPETNTCAHGLESQAVPLGNTKKMLCGFTGHRWTEL